MSTEMTIVEKSDLKVTQPPKFEVTNFKIGKVCFTYLFLILIQKFLLQTESMLLFLNIIATLLIIPVWIGMKKKIVGDITTSIVRYKIKKRSTIKEWMVGLNLEKHIDYFLESEDIKLDLSKTVETFKSKLWELIQTSVGISLILAKFFVSLYPPEIANESDFAFYTLEVGATFTPISTLIVGFIIPFIWAASDIKIAGLTKDSTIVRLEEKIHNGIFGKVIGMTGIMVMFTDVQSWLLSGGDYGSSTGILEALTYPFGILLVAFFIAPYMASPYLVGMIYLKNTHGQIVDNIRKRIVAEKILPIKVVKTEVLNNVNYDQAKLDLAKNIAVSNYNCSDENRIREIYNDLDVCSDPKVVMKGKDKLSQYLSGKSSFTSSKVFGFALFIGLCFLTYYMFTQFTTYFLTNFV